MIEQFGTKETTDIEFRLLSVAALIKKDRANTTIEELYIDAERKFNTLIELLNDTYTNNSILDKFEYSLDDLKKIALLVLNRLISDANANSYMTLCVLEDASYEEIKRRRNMLLNIFHPDKNLEKFNNGGKTRQINEAYDNIINNKNRTNIVFGNGSRHIPPSYPYDNQGRKRMRILIFLIILFSLLVVLGFINKSYFI